MLGPLEIAVLLAIVVALVAAGVYGVKQLRKH